MNDAERAFAIQYLEQTRERVLSFARSLPVEQRDFHKTEDDWSPAELIEHIIVLEQLALRQIASATPNESRRGKGAHKDLMILEGVPARLTKAKAPEFVCPNGRWPDWNVLLGEFGAVRSRVINFAKTAETDLRIHFAPHLFFKDLDQYQWLILIAAHSERHIRQAEEMLAATAAAQ